MFSRLVQYTCFVNGHILHVKFWLCCTIPPSAALLTTSAYCVVDGLQWRIDEGCVNQKILSLTISGSWTGSLAAIATTFSAGLRTSQCTWLCKRLGRKWIWFGVIRQLPSIVDVHPFFRLVLTPPHPDSVLVGLRRSLVLTWCGHAAY